MDGATGKRALARGHAGDALSHAHGGGQLGALQLRRAWACSRTDRSAKVRPIGAGRSRAWPWARNAAGPAAAGGRPTSREAADRAATPARRCRCRCWCAQKKCRRVMASPICSSKSIAYSLVMVSSRFRIVLATMVQAASSLRSSFGSAGVSPTLSSFRAASSVAGGIAPIPARSRSSRTAHFAGVGLARGGQAKAEAHARCRICGRPARGCALGQHARRLHVSRIVQQHQRLQAACWSQCGAPCTSRGRARRTWSATAGGTVRFQNVYMLRR